MSLFCIIKSYCYSFLPDSLKKRIDNRKLYEQTLLYDKQRLMRFSFSNAHNVDNLRAHLRMLTHFIEKGLTMPSPRPCFGIIRLRLIAEVVEQLGPSNSNLFEMQYISKIMDEYLSFHDNREVALPEEHLKLIHRIKEITGNASEGFHASQRHYSKNEFFTISDGQFSSIALSRHSVRNFISTPIPKEVFITAASVAQTAPSACNRQPCHLYVLDKRPQMDKLLSLIRGCNGFGHLASAILIITSDLSCRDNLSERHQVGIDTGFWGMNLLYALHEKHIGACVLNWDNIKEDDEKLRAVFPQIPEDETIMYFVCCGYTPDEFDIPLGLRIDNNISFIE